MQDHLSTRRSTRRRHTDPAVTSARAQRPTVALVAHAVHDSGGMERAFAELIRRIHTRYRVVVVSSELASSLTPLVEWRPVPVPPRPFPIRFLTFFIFGGLRLRSAQADLVHTLGAIVPNRVDAVGAHFCHAGFHSATGRFAPPGAPPLRKLNTALTRLLSILVERWCYRPTRLRRFLAVSEGLATELTTYFPGIPVKVVPNGVDLERYRPDPEARRDMRTVHGLAPDDVVVLFVGGDWDRKGLSVVVEALARTPRARLWVVGQGNQAAVSSLAHSLGLHERVTFFGPRDDTERFYAASDVFCLPSLYETFSLVAHEAAASGLPIVATPVSGLVDLVGRNEAGFLVERTAASVGSALEQLTQDAELRARLGDEALRRTRCCTWDASTAVTVNQFEELLSQPSARAR